MLLGNGRQTSIKTFFDLSKIYENFKCPKTPKNPLKFFLNPFQLLSPTAGSEHSKRQICFSVTAQVFVSPVLWLNCCSWAIGSSCVGVDQVIKGGAAAALFSLDHRVDAISRLSGSGLGFCSCSNHVRVWFNYRNPTSVNTALNNTQGFVFFFFRRAREERRSMDFVIGRGRF